MIENQRPFSELGPYELVDFGNGRKLERFATRLLDRPSPAADGVRPKNPSLWNQAQSVFDKRGKQWLHRRRWAESIGLDCDGFVMPIQPTPFGHVGVFPEQFQNWRWLQETTPPIQQAPSQAVRQGLNLFGYTGASSMAMATTGLAVAHVDAAKPNVNAARDAATANGLSEHPIRYLVDDAVKFVAREVRRERRYDTIVLDPPAYGHSPKGKTWRLERDLWPLLDQCIELIEPDRFRLLVTGHSPQVDAPDVVDYLKNELPSQAGVSRTKVAKGIESGRLTIQDPAGRHLDFGFYVRIAFESSST
ncbi:class I SAM-dependent methyltransferase [Stieleria sp. JC731]|uniref:class I SAM-dependent methyltransferase n=1 Tax=Pirellulaceae TaxID=2691357 RepID=UPI001E605FEE|nr:class I SAM-dependent methyltransferase [Stieleria sp. JC731]MCC9603186.1 class I SAM-dependent methyltransferase [Stieleria sp. JC731]